MKLEVLAVVSYPLLEEDDRRWIEAIRARHDPQAARLGVHFTLVFPAQVLPAEAAMEVSTVARAATPITFAIRRARAVPDPLGGGAHVFLVPDEGREEIARLHDQLYQGVLQPHLREDGPFTPHLTVAAGSDLNWCEDLAQALNGHQRTVRGTLASIELINVEGHRVVPIGSFPLGTCPWWPGLIPG